MVSSGTNCQLCTTSLFSLHVQSSHQSLDRVHHVQDLKNLLAHRFQEMTTCDSSPAAPVFANETSPTQCLQQLHAQSSHSQSWPVGSSCQSRQKNWLQLLSPMHRSKTTEVKSTHMLPLLFSHSAEWSPPGSVPREKGSQNTKLSIQA